MAVAHNREHRPITTSAANSKRGAKPGERRGGRQKGTPNKITADVKALARVYGPEAIKALAKLMRTASSEKARASAASDLLDRGYGRPSQAITGEDGGPVQHVHRVELVDLEGGK